MLLSNKWVAVRMLHSWDLLMVLVASLVWLGKVAILLLCVLLLYIVLHHRLCWVVVIRPVRLD